LRKFGASEKRVCRYHGTKEDVYLTDFQPDPSFNQQLSEMEINAADILVVVRPPAHDALYHRFANELFEQLLDWLAQRPVRVLLLPRNIAQREQYSGRAANFLMPPEPLDGANLIAASDLLISAGGTMNREAAALGVPAATIYAGRWAAVDEALCRAGRLMRLTSVSDFTDLPLKKKGAVLPPNRIGVRNEVVSCILNSIRSGEI
jgi:predicted glycosyltransferase